MTDPIVDTKRKYDAIKKSHSFELNMLNKRNAIDCESVKFDLWNHICLFSGTTYAKHVTSGFSNLYLFLSFCMKYYLWENVELVKPLVLVRT